MIPQDKSVHEVFDYSQAYYDAIAKMTPQDLSSLWMEETEDRYNEMLGALPPIKSGGGAFMVGECMSHTKDGAIYEVHIDIGRRYFFRPALLHSFDPRQYFREVNTQFLENHTGGTL